LRAILTLPTEMKDSFPSKTYVMLNPFIRRQEVNVSGE